MHKKLTKFEKYIIATYGEMGLQWLNSLPELLEQIAEAYKLTLHKPFENLNYGLVLPVIGPNNEDWIIKLSVPNKEFENEIRAVKYYNEIGCVRCIYADMKAA